LPDRATCAWPAPGYARAAILAALFAFVALVPESAHGFFSTQSVSGASGAGTDYLDRSFAIVPGSATQPGTVTPTTTGAGRTLSVDLGRVPDSRTIVDVVRVTNTGEVARPLNLSLLGSLTSVLGFEFSDGSTAKTIDPGATWQIRVRTDAAAAGAFAGQAQLQEGADTFMRIERPMTTRQAPLPAGALTIAAPAGTVQAQLSWTASPSTGVAGYNVYRATSAAGPFAKVNGSLVTASSYVDTTVTLGGNYWYRVRAVASAISPDLESPDTATAQTTVMPQPASVEIPASSNNAVNWVSRMTRSSVTFRVVVPAATSAGDTVALAVTNGTNTINRTATATGGMQTIDFTGNNLNTWADAAMGAITMSARIVRGQFAAPAITANAGKDTTVPARPTAAQVIAGTRNPVNYVNSFTALAAPVRVTTTAGVTERVEARLSSGATGATASVFGPGMVTVPVNTASLADTAVGRLAVAARVVDAAGNASNWFSGTPATRDTAAPSDPNVARITFTNRRFGRDRVRGNSNALAANAQVRVLDHGNGAWYPTGGSGWHNGTRAGGFNQFNIASGGLPRTLQFESRDAAWNLSRRVCGRWTASRSAGVAVACP
jgi:hypothetical protein